MAPKRAKPVIDLTADDEDDDERPQPKRRCVTRKKESVAANLAGDINAGSGPSGSAGPSAVIQTPPAPAGRGRRRTAAKEATPVERRVDEDGGTVMYRPRASQDVKARVARAMPGSAHRMFLVDTRPLAPLGAEGGPAQEFHVLGATGNVYSVRISCQPHCTCPDFGKGNLCKHILFVMLRVLRQRQDDPVIWQRALLRSEVEALLGCLSGGPAGGPDQGVLASEGVRQRYAAIVGAAGGSGGGAGAAAGVQRLVEGDCPICYEELTAQGGGAGEAIVFCHSCGNNMHKECFNRWASTKRSTSQAVTCVYCRAPWQAGGAAGEPGGSSPGEYVNLSQYSDAHRSGTSLEDLYGTNAYFIMANAGEISRRQAARMHAAARGWV